MSKKVKFLGLSPRLTEVLVQRNVASCKDILNKSNLELMLLLQISIQSANEIIYRASKATSPSATNALQMSDQSVPNKQSLKSTLDVLDDLLSGGFRKGLITEISGPPGCGKTQFCLMLAVVFVTLDDNRNRSVIYIDTEGAFDANRLVEIACHKYPHKYCSSESLQSLAKRIIICRDKQFNDLKRRLENLEEEIIVNKAGLVIIDSIASLVRREFNGHFVRNIYERNKLLSRQASLLKFLASEYNFPVLVTNQITTQFKSDFTSMKKIDFKTNVTDDSMDDVSSGGESNVVIALGVQWSHCINARIVLQYSTLTPSIRELHLVKSPQAPYVKLYYTVESSGIVIQSNGDYCARSNFPLNVNTKSGLSLENESFMEH